MKFIKLNEHFSEIRQIVNCFYSFFILNNKLYSVHRRHKLFSQENWPRKKSENFSKIILTEYINKDPDQISFEEVICDGEDPRVSSNGKKAFVLSRGTVHSGVIYTLTVLPEKKNILVKLGEGVQLGKNWQPLIIGSDFYVIDSISPFRVNKLDVNTGLIEKEKQIEVDFTLKAAHDNYSILRGGSNAFEQNDIVYGWGHATVKPYSHIPFIWEYNSEGLTTSFINIHSFFKKKGYNIVDPASFFEWDNDSFAVSLSCSQRDWFHSQWFLNALFLIKKNDFFEKRFKFPVVETKMKSIFFHTTELDSLIDSSIVNGGRCNNGKKGCLVCGPSQEIDLSKRWVVELCYSSTSKLSKRVGIFDIFLTINGVNKQVARTKIYGTNGESSRVMLSFKEKFESNKALIQTRVFTNKRTVTAYYFELYEGE